MAKLLRSPQAVADLEDIWFAIAVDSPTAADRFIARIEQAEDRLADFPEMAPLRDDLARGLRAWPVGEYLILYRADPGTVLISRTFHGARDIRALLDT